jgi:hypothetical protein
MFFASVGLAQTVPFKSLCFSNVCLGDDLTKISALRITSWFSEENQRKQPPTPRSGVVYHQSAPRPRPVSPANIKMVQKAFLGLTEADYRVLASSVPSGGSLNQDIQLFLPPVLFVELNDATLPLLRKALTCTALPVHGIFKSESGHYTSVLLLSDHGKLRVVKTARKWMPAFQETTTDTQKAQISSQQLNELWKQIIETYGGDWHNNGGTVQRTTNFTAKSDDAVAYFDTRDMAHPVMTLYASAFSQFTKSNDPWDAVATGYEQTLASTPGCAVSTPSVKIN